MRADDFYKHSFKLEHGGGSLYVQNTGRQQCIPGYRWGPGIRDHYLIHHILAGRGHFVVDGQHYTLSAGDTFLVYPNKIILYYADKQDPWEYVWVGFQGREAGGLVEQTPFAPDSPVLRGVCPEGIRRLMLELYSDYGTAVWSGCALTGRLYLFLAFLVAHGHRDTAGEQDREGCAEQAARYVMNHYEQPISVEQLAEFVSTSQNSLYRSFKERFQVSPKHFIVEYRIEQACRLLSSGMYSVREISNSVGFEDPLYFSRAFKRVKGLSPKAYAEQCRKNGI